MRRASVLTAVGVLAGGALALGVAAPANAVDTAPLSSYMLTVPPSVYSAAAGYSPAEQAAWRESARLGVDPKPPTVPVSGGAAWALVGGVQALWLGGQFIVENGGTFGTVFGVNPTQMQERYASQGLEDPVEAWQCESLEGDWLGDLVTGFNDWFQGLFGVDCAAARDGKLDRNPEYVPLENEDPGAAGYPFTAKETRSGYSPQEYRVHEPFWSNSPSRHGSDGSRVEGWVYPIEFLVGSGPTVYPQWRAADGSVVFSLSNGTTVSHPSSGARGYDPVGVHPECTQVNVRCYVPQTRIGTDVPTSNTTAMAMLNQFSISSGGADRVNLLVPPYVDPLGGNPPTPAGQEVVFLTTVETQDGNVYRCRTEPFLETDVDVPTPCEPTVPGDEWMISRTVEMIPATATDWVSGSDPRRVMTDQESPQEYRDWKTAFPMCADVVCRMDLVKIGKGSCFQLGSECDGWASDPNRASAYTCTYNGQTVSLSECEAGYPNVFNQQARDLGQAYPQPTDPATGQPSTGGQTSTIAGPVTQPGAWPSNPEQPRNCFPTGWNAFNPWEWIYKPVKCVFEWAFVPRQSYIDNVIGNIRTVWTSASLVSLLGVLEDGADIMFGPQGCEGPEVDLSVYGGDYSGHPFSACGQFAGAASITSTVTGIAAWLFASLSIARSIGGVVAFRGLGGGDDE